MERTHILLVGTGPALEASLAGLLGAPLLSAAPDAAQALALVRKARPDLAVVRVQDPSAAGALDLVRELAAAKVPVLVVGPGRDPDAILAAMRAGAREYVPAGEEGQATERVQALLESSGALRLGQVVALFPAKGGMGATSLATHLAGALCRASRRVCLVDLDLELGDVLSFLDLRGTYTLADVAANTHRLDRELLDASVPRHASGVHVLSQCEKVTDAERLDPGTIGGLIRFLRQHYDHVVIDGLRDFGERALAALDLADRIEILVTQEVPAVRSAQRCVGYLRQLGFEAARLRLVVNRYLKASPITRAVIEETVGLPVSATVGNDFQSLSSAVNRGVLLWEEAPRSVVARDVEALAATLLPGPVAAPPRESLLQRLLSLRVGTHGLD